MTCSKCGSDVDPERAEYLESERRPVTCLQCSEVKPALVLFEYAHKTAGTAVVVGSDPEQIRLARRAYRRAR